MIGSNSPNFLKQVGACLLVALIVSLLIGLGFALSDFGEFTAFETVKISAGMAALASPFVAVGILFIGLPALMLARKTGVTFKLFHLCAVGAATGALAAPAVMLLVFRNSGDGLLVLAAIGAGCGMVAATLWWHLIEKLKLTDSKNV